MPKNEGANVVHLATILTVFRVLHHVISADQKDATTSYERATYNSKYTQVASSYTIDQEFVAYRFKTR